MVKARKQDGNVITRRFIIRLVSIMLCMDVYEEGEIQEGVVQMFQHVYNYRYSV